MSKKTQIKAEIVADSMNQMGDRLTSLLVTFPRIILAEINTHRMLSKNTSSSRAIPFKKMVESVENDPFIPIAWQKDHKGMQGVEYITDKVDIEFLEDMWESGIHYAVQQAKALNNPESFPDKRGATKQLCNRLLEPFMWTTMLITGSKEGWDNFFNLRCPQYDLSEIKIRTYEGMTFNPLCKSWKDVIIRTALDLFDKGPYSKDEVILKELEEYPTIKRLKLNKGQAEIHIMDLAEKIYDAMKESIPKQLEPGEWHIPFWKQIPFISGTEGLKVNTLKTVKISTAMAARTSYTVVGDEKEINYERMIGLHDRLLAQDPPHSSPMEHCARVMTDEEYYLTSKGMEGQIDHQHGWCYNLRGFMSYRYLLENDMIK